MTDLMKSKVLRRVETSQMKTDDKARKFIEGELSERGVPKRRPHGYLVTLMVLLPILMGAACDQSSPAPSDSSGDALTENTPSMSDTLVIKIGSSEFTGTLLDNPTATAFKALLPLTINMTELNGNEKYFDLSKGLPTNASNPGRINAGDLLLYGSKTLVLFYETFSTSYTYTRLGKISNANGLAEALGAGNVVVTIELK
jgi:hypothetical protein